MSTLADRLVMARLRRARHRHPADRASYLRALWRELQAWRRRSRERQELARMTLRDLQDIGLTPGEALREVVKPFWRG